MIKIIFAFLAGAIVGSVSGYAVCRRICEKEIESVKEMYHAKSVQQPAEKNPYAGKREEAIKPQTELKKSEVERINKILDDMDYSESSKGDDEIMKPFQINPDEFGEDDAYGQAMLEYYSDGTIVDDEDCVLTRTSIRNLLGPDIHAMFNDTDEDVIYVRNPAVMVDYMITRNDETYYKDGQK